MIGTRHKPDLYRARLRVHEWMPTAWFLTLLPVAVLLIIDQYLRWGGSIPHVAIVQRVVVGLIIAAFAAALLLRVFAFWHSVVLRQLAWWGACAAGAAWRWLTSGWRVPLLLVLGIGWIWREHPRIFGKPPIAWVDLFTINTTAAVIACMVLLVLAYQTYQARRRITILAFTNYAGDEHKSFVDGLSTRLLGDLRQLSDLYKVIDAANPPAGPDATGSRPSRAIGVTASVEDVGTALRDAVSTETKVKLWFFEVPIGAIVAAFARFVQGPRLSGSLHREGPCLILMARLEAKGQSLTWRVEAEIPPGATGAAAGRAFATLMNDLVYRIFTEQVSVGSPKWEAVQYFSEGLRTFRRTLTMQREHSPRLWHAERLFIKALAEDNTFARCYHNLGVVYSKLRRNASARAAYERALRETPLPEAAYALAELLWNEKDYAGSLRVARRAIALRPTHALSWQLAALAQAEEQSGGVDVPPPTETAYWRGITGLREIAAALAWRDLCRAALRGEPLDMERRAVEACFGDLAGTYIINGRRRLGRVLIAQALSQVNAAVLHFYRGVSLFESEHYARSAREHRAALLVEDHPLYLLHLNGAEARDYDSRGAPDARERAIQAYRRIMETPSALSFVMLADLLNICDRIKVAEQKHGDPRKVVEAAALRARTHLVRSINKYIVARPDETEEHWVKRLHRLAGRARKKLAGSSPDGDPLGWGWAYGMIAVELADKLRKEQERQKRIELLKDACEWLKPYPRELVAHQVLVRYAAALRLAGENELSLDIAKQAVSINPVGAPERRVLGDAYLALKDYGRAEKEIRVSLDIDPSDKETIAVIASLHFDRGTESRDKASRREALQRGLKSYQDVIELRDDLGTQEAGALHFWIGRYHLELMQFDQGRAELNIAIAQGFHPLESRRYIAWSLMDQEAFNEAERQLDTLIDGVRGQYRSLLQSAGPDRVRHKQATVPGEDLSFNELMFDCCLASSYVYLERGGDTKRAQRALDVARLHLAQLPRSVRREFTAACDEMDGWIRYRRGHIVAAFEKLEEALRQSHASGTHFYLATVCLARAQAPKTSKAKKAHWLRLARHHCGSALAGDLRGALTDRVGVLQASIEKA